MSQLNPKNSNQNNEDNIFAFEKPYMGFDNFGKFLFSPVTSTVKLTEFFSETLFGIVRTACVPSELIFRRNFGERYFNLYLYFGGAMWFWIFALGMVNIPALLGLSITPLVSNAVIFTIVGIIFFSLMIWHLVIRKFMPINVDCYARYDGDVFPLFYYLPYAKDQNGNPREYLIRQLYEPGFILLLGIAIAIFINPQTGSWLILSAIGMAVKECVRFQKVRNLILDQIDADIVGKNLKAAIKGEPVKNTQGVYIAGMPRDGKLKERFVASVNTPK